MFSTIIQYFTRKRPENSEKCAAEKRLQFEELIDRLLESDDEEENDKKNENFTKNSKIQIDELSWNCTRHEGMFTVIQYHFFVIL